MQKEEEPATRGADNSRLLKMLSSGIRSDFGNALTGTQAATTTAAQVAIYDLNAVEASSSPLTLPEREEVIAKYNEDKRHGSAHARRHEEREGGGEKTTSAWRFQDRHSLL